MQYKIPQEVDIEDKIVGPFTLKGFGFIFAAAVTAILCLVIFMRLGLSFIPSIIVGGFFGSLFIILGFLPFNGRPIYTFTLPLIQFFTKPRQRVWKKEIEKPKPVRKPDEEEKAKAQTPEARNPIKQPLTSVEKQIEEISLTVDTGGAYSVNQMQEPRNQAGDIFEEGSSERIEQELEKAREEVESKNTKPEPTISKMASIDPEKKFDYEYPDTSKYTIDEKLKPKDE